MSKFKLWKRKTRVSMTGRDLGVGFSAMIGGCRKGRFRTTGMSKILEGWAYVVGIICYSPSGIGLNNLSKQQWRRSNFKVNNAPRVYFSTLGRFENLGEGEEGKQYFFSIFIFIFCPLDLKMFHQACQCYIYCLFPRLAQLPSAEFLLCAVYNLFHLHISFVQICIKVIQMWEWHT